GASKSSGQANKGREEKKAEEGKSESGEASKSVGESGSSRGRRSGSAFPDTASGGGGADPKKRRTDETYTGSVGLYTPGSSVLDKVERQRKSQYLGITGLTQQEKEKVEKERLKTRKIANDSGQFRAKKKMRVQRIFETKKKSRKRAQAASASGFVSY
ncbi:MAG: hypothetical protein AB7H97_12940, partial [Pseudobdellovibrionaceae bacterium]